MDPLLAAVLAERERRFLRRAELAEKYGGTIVQLTISAPGIRKDGEDIRKAARFGAALLERAFAERGLRIRCRESGSGQAGPCIFLGGGCRGDARQERRDRP